MTRWLVDMGAVGAGALSDDEDGDGDDVVTGGGSGGGAGRGPLRLGPRGASPADEEGGVACAHCRRTYPHEHVRALRTGGDHGQRGSDDEA